MRSEAAVEKKEMQAQERDALIRAHTGLARNLALRLAGRVPSCVTTTHEPATSPPCWESAPSPQVCL